MMKPENALQRAFSEGVIAFNAVDDLTVVNPLRKQVPANPYKFSSMYYKEWERGFNSSYYKTGNRT